MGTVHQFPVGRNQRESSPAADVARALRRAIDAQVGPDAPFAAREQIALTLANEATRGFLQDDLEALADRHGAQVEVDGRLYQRHEPGTVRYYTLCGPIDLERWSCREVGVRNGPTIVPLDLDAGVVEQATAALGYRVTLGYAKGHMRSCEEDMRADHRCPSSRSTLERMAKAIGTAATRVAPRIIRRVRGAERVPEGDSGHRAGARPGGVPMEEDLAEGETPTSRRTTRRKPYTRTPPDSVNVHYRMAYVGTISFHDRDGELLGSRCYTAAAHESPTDRVVSPLVADLRQALGQDPLVVVGVIQDGAPELWNLLPPAVAAEPQVTWYYEAIDRYHLTERLGDVLRVLEPDTAPRAARLSRWNESLDRKDKALYRIREEIRTAYAEAIARQDDTIRDQLDPHLTYFENNASLMRYARLRTVGLPVGSVTDAACKSVIVQRTNGRSQRWRPAGLDAVLTLRSLHISDRLPRFWANLARTYRKEVTLCA